METNFDILCSSLDVLGGNMGLDCIRIYQDFIWTSSSGNGKLRWCLCACVYDLSACMICVLWGVLGDMILMVSACLLVIGDHFP